MTRKLPDNRPTKGQKVTDMRPVKVRYGPPSITGTKRAEQSYKPIGSQENALVEVYELNPVTFDIRDENDTVIGQGTRTPLAVVYDDCPWDDEVGTVIWVANDLDHLRRSWQAIPLPSDVYDAMLTELGTTRISD